MRVLFGVLLTATVLFAVEDGWKKVQELKTGTEVRVLKKGSMKPLIGTFDEANDERLVLVIKNEQSAVAKAEIDRVDYRPPKSTGRITKETTTRSGVDAQSSPPRGAPTGTEGMNSSTSTNMVIGGKPDFETLYRRPPRAPK